MKSNTASNRDQNIMGTPDRVNAAWGLALAAYCIAKLWFVDGVELGKDEAVYWYWSQHLDASYALLPFSLMALAHALAPYCEWVLRLPSVLLGALSTYLLFALCIVQALPKTGRAGPPQPLPLATGFGIPARICIRMSFSSPVGF